MVAFDDGSNNLYWDNADPDVDKGFPVFQAAPMGNQSINQSIHQSIQPPSSDIQYHAI